MKSMPHFGLGPVFAFDLRQEPVRVEGDVEDSTLPARRSKAVLTQLIQRGEAPGLLGREPVGVRAQGLGCFTGLDTSHGSHAE